MTELELVNKFILDATAGHRMMHFNKQNPYVLYVDKRAEVNPDIVGDHKDLAVIPDKSFKLIIFDPPHRTTKDAPYWVIRDYGGLEAETWQSDLKKAFTELWRLLDDFGVLVFKWNDHQFKGANIEQLFPVDPIVKQTTTNGTSSNTFWYCFMKIVPNKVSSDQK
mgnify:FL=1